MKHSRWTLFIALLFAVAGIVVVPAEAQDQGKLIPAGEIAALQAKLAAAGESASSARQKLAIKRVIREADGLLEANPAAPNRYEVLGILFKSQQQLVGLDDSATNRTAFLETCRLLAAAPNEYAAVRLDADLLLSQIEIAKQGADAQERAAALLPLVDRYQETEVETKVIKVAMIMALEMGNTRVIARLRQIIAQRCPGDSEMINFQRDQLAGQVFGAPFVGQFKGADGRAYRLPMDGMGKTTALYFWTKEGDGLEQLKLLAEGWKKVNANDVDNAANVASRYQVISFNLDGLADAGESLLRDAGLDWPALHLPGGAENTVYKTYARNTPKLLVMTPTGYTAMVMGGSTRIGPERGWERSFQSMLARTWTQQHFTAQVQSLLIGDFLVIDPAGAFDPAAPPEWKAVHAQSDDPTKKLKRTAASVPEDKLRAIQACFVKPPLRYNLLHKQVRANYAKAEALCRQAIAEHPDADDLWIVRNRRIVALAGLWKVEQDRKHFDAALQEAITAMQAGYPAGTDLIARFCLAREALRADDADLAGVIDSFVQASGDESEAAPTLAIASMLAMEIGERRLHERYRRAFLDKHANNPMMWTATAYLLDRAQRYWLYHPPFTAGWTYGRRMGYFYAIGTPEDAHRTFQAELKTLYGEIVKTPEASNGKWTVIEFAQSAANNPHIDRYGTFTQTRPFEDVNFFSAVFNEDAQAVKAAVSERAAKRRKSLDDLPPTLLVPGGLSNPLVNQLGIVVDEKTPNILILRPDATIAVVLSGSSLKGGVVQNVIEWHDEKAVDDALARGDLEEAKRLAFAHAPVEQVKPEDAPRHWKPKKLTVPHLRSRAKVYMAMEDWQAAYDDIQEVYLVVNSKAGHLSMRTDELDATEKLKALIERNLERLASAQ